eukprot:m.115619 g.115619  ORF g.115619 m.115619 type:complete len:408 (+) comp37553_c0_seq2:285-1508(+)
MQVYLFQEREHVLRLYAENDRLKIKELEDRDKIQKLILMTQSVPSEMTYVKEREPPGEPRFVVVKQYKKDDGGQKKVRKGKVERHEGETVFLGDETGKGGFGWGRGPGGHKHKKETKAKGDGPSLPDSDRTSLALTIESLHSQLEDQTRLAKEQVEALLQDRQVRMEENQVQRDRDEEKLSVVTGRLHEVQELLYESTKDFLELKYKMREKERVWIIEKDRLLQDLDDAHEELKVHREAMEDGQPSFGISAFETSGGTYQNQLVIRQLKAQLQEARKLGDIYREQGIHLEEELCKVREEYEASKGIFKERTDRLTKRLALMNQRYSGLDKRRGFEVEGFKNDVKLLKQQLKDVEKQLYKITLNFGGNQDVEILRGIHHTAHRSKKLVGELQYLKANVYSLENRVRQL